jgi:DNA (cytosine-5)-methyltransferase 1
MPGRYSSENLIRSENLKCLPGQIIKLPQKLDNERLRKQWTEKLADPSIPKVIDLFCGAGGMSEGFIEAGFTVVAGFDKDPHAVQTFAANHEAMGICTDIDSIENPQELLADLKLSGVDVVIGGPPCQGFSQVGRARIRSLKQTEQTRLLARNELYQHYFRFVEAFKPRFFVIENVPNLVTYEEGAYLLAIEQESKRLGYTIQHDIIEAADYGVPQKRRRLFIVGYLADYNFDWPRTDSKQERVSLHDAIGDLPKVKPPMLNEEQEYLPSGELTLYQQYMRSRVSQANKTFIYDHIVRPVRADDITIFQMMKPGGKYTDIPEEYRRYNSESFKDKYYMLRPDAPSVTVTAHLDKDGYRYIHWDREQHRTISIREAARIQSFGDQFRFAGSRSSRFRQIGNAVPPMMAQEIARKVKRGIERGAGILPGDVLQLGLPWHERRSELILSYDAG